MNDKEHRFDIPTLCTTFGATYVEAQILQILLDEEIASHKQLDYVSLRARQIIHTLRLKLAEYKIEIVSTRDKGYAISFRDKLRIKNIIDKEIADELKSDGLPATGTEP